MTLDVQQLLLKHALALLAPVTAVGEDPKLVSPLIRTAGWNPDALGGSAINAVVAAFANCKVVVDRLDAARANAPLDLPTLGAALGSLSRAVSELTTASPAWPAQPDLPPNLHEIFFADLADALLELYLHAHQPQLWTLLRLTRVVRETPRPQIARRDGVILRSARTRRHIDFKRLGQLLSDPAQLLHEQYVAGESGARPPAVIADEAGPLLAELLQGLGLSAWYGSPGRTEGEPLTADEQAIAAHLLHVILLYQVDPTTNDAGLLRISFALDRTGAGLALVVVPSGELEVTRPVGDWAVSARADAAVEALVITRQGATFPADGAAEFGITVTARRPVGNEPMLRLGAAGGTRFEIGGVSLSVSLRARPNAVSFTAGLELAGTRVAIAPPPGDGFLSSIFPAEPLTTELPLALEWSPGGGLRLRGSSGLRVVLPRSISIGPLTLSLVTLALEAGNKSLNSELSAALSITLGPLSAVAERVGIRAELAEASRGGSLGALDLALGIKPPSGIALKIEAPSIIGGGYLFFDEQKSQYAGVLQLELAQTIGIKAIGLLTTRMPDGSRGFSLLIIITAEGFAPIQLGFGFKLTGIGGLLGVNRTAAVDALRSGIKAGTLGSILFPADPVRNAPRIVSDVGTVFPPAPGRYVFGPMVMIEWGTPSLLKLEIGVVLELPDPVRLLILGRLTAALPDEKNPLVQIRMDALGVIDFAAGELSLDATLYDSRLLSFVLTGDMAMRASWGKNPNFLLAIGGWNPRFAAPAGFPALARMALTLSGSANARLRLESYLAITSNTLQFGARVDFYFAVEPFSVDGHLGFDALFHFNPFSFIADLSASVALRMNGAVLLSVALEMTLTGPSPWHIWGKAQFSVLFFKQTISFDAQFGPDQRPTLPDPVDVKALLTNALADARNWSSELPTGERPLVTFRPFAANTNVLRVHPLAEVAVRERVVPLDMRITKFGNAPVSGQNNKFSLKAVRSDDGREIPSTNISDDFALAQFVEMSDDQKLASPAFTQEHAGLRFTTGEFAYGYEPTLDAVITYETLLIQPAQPAQKLQPYALPSSVLDGAITLGAAAQAAAQRSDKTPVR